MADAKISELVEKTDRLSDDDLLVIVDTEVIPNTTKRVKKSTAFDGTTEVLKATPGTIPAGSAVNLVGYDAIEEVSTVELADASSDATMPAFGITSDEITDTVKGIVVKSGSLRNQDTSAFSVGDFLYVSETAGELTSTKPQGTALIQKIGTVLQQSATIGVIQIFGAGRSNDLPNIPEGEVWIGDSNGVPQGQDLDARIASNPDISSNTTHRSSDGKDHSDVVLNNTHRSSDGKDHSDVVLNNSHRVATGNPHGADTDDIPEGTSNLYATPLSFVQYYNTTAQTFDNAVSNINFGSDFGSVLNGQFTKVSATDFRTDFAGYVRISCTASVRSDTNQRGVELFLTKNATEITGTRRIVLTFNGAVRGSNYAIDVIVPCAVNDVFRLRADSTNEGVAATIPANHASFTVQKV